jgi:hypothetical protein
MIPDETGRYCNSCKRSVIDFTEKTDEEIQQFIANNIDQSLCGRFKNSQVERIVIDLPQNIFSIQMPLWMRFLVACVLIFGISIFPFETTIAGKIPEEISFFQGQSISAKNEKKSRILKKKKNRTRFNKSYIKLKSTQISDIAIAGGMWISTDHSVVKSIIDFQVNEYPESELTIMSTEATTHNKTLPQKEQPHPAPFSPTEFILPAILSIRKETNDPSMD